MEVRQHIEAQVRALDDDVYEAQCLLAAFRPDPGPIADMRVFFEDRLRRVADDVEELAKAVADEDESEAQLWNRLGKLQATMRTRGLQLLAYVEGGLLRQAIDADDRGRPWQVADALLAELSTATQIPWQRFTVPGTEEYIDTETQVIRLSCPGFGDWDLPIVVHEFGHFAGPQIKRHGLATFDAMRRNREDRERNHLDELFGDVFALHVGGPAYLCNAIVTRFSPTLDEAVTATDTHPSFAERVAVMLDCLRAAPDAGQPDWRWLVERLEEAWQTAVVLAGHDPQVEPARSEQLDRLRRRFDDDVLGEVPPYTGWSRSRVLADELALRGNPRRGLAGCSLRDVLNAAWLARLRRPQDTLALGQFLAATLPTVATRATSGDGRSEN